MKPLIIILLLIYGLLMLYKLWFLKEAVAVHYGILLIGVSLSGVLIQDYITKVGFRRSTKRKS